MVMLSDSIRIVCSVFFAFSFKHITECSSLSLYRVSIFLLWNISSKFVIVGLQAIFHVICSYIYNLRHVFIIDCREWESTKFEWSLAA